MPAPERDIRPRPSSYPTRSLSPSSVPMKDLLASCAAARAVSTPPSAPEPDAGREAGLELLRKNGEGEQKRGAARERDAA
ncbi:hypothetical protein ACFXP3_30705 [Streptomyces sp. NPDC059096]|uniref:hypothetical protein n=1 Tax=unclassified Streptomyces TaxID=2593676 RepID=UPI0036C3A0D8